MIIRKRDGSPIVVSLNSQVLHDTEGNSIGVEGILRDISLRKQAEMALQVSEERFHKITDLSPLPIAIISESGNYLYVNNIFSQLFGYTLKDIPTEKDWFSLAFPDIYEREEARLMWETDFVHSVTQEPDPVCFQ